MYPTIKIALFGARSTGKTNLLASFFGVDTIQDCSIDLNDSETRKALAANWKRLQMGDVPSATAVTDEKPLEFRLCQKVSNHSVDEFGWNIVMKDYAGKLVEEECGLDAISEEIKANLAKKLAEFLKLEAGLARDDFHEPELSLFKKMDAEKKNVLIEIRNEIDQKLAELSYEDIDENDVVKYRNTALKRIEVYQRYSQYYPEKSDFAPHRESLEYDAKMEQEQLSSYLKEQLAHKIIELGTPKTFEDKCRFGEESERIYLQFAGYYPDDSEMGIDLEQKAASAKKDRENLQKYVALEQEVQNVRDLFGLERQKKADRVLKNYTLEEYPLAETLFAEVRKLRNEGYSVMLENLKSKGGTDSPDDSFDDRVVSSQSRLKLYKDELPNFDEENQKEIQLWITREEERLKDLKCMLFLETNYAEVKSYYNSNNRNQDKLSKCDKYLNESAQSTSCTKFPQYEEWKSNVTAWQKKLSDNIAVENWLSDFDDFRQRFAERTDELSEISSTIDELTSEIPIITSDMEEGLKTRLETAKSQLETMRMTNTDNAESLAYDKIKSATSTLKALPTPEHLNTAIEAANAYLEDPLLGQQAESVKALKTRLEGIRNQRLLKISVTYFNVGGTYFNNYCYDNDLRFCFETGDDQQTISFRGDGVGTSIGSVNLNTSCSTNDMKISLINTSPERDKDDETFNLLAAVFSGERQFKVIFKDRNSDSAVVEFTIENLPLIPN